MDPAGRALIKDHWIARLAERHFEANEQQRPPRWLLLGIQKAAASKR